LNVTHYYDIILISENTVYADHLKKLSVDEEEYKYFDLPSLGSGYGKYESGGKGRGGDRDRESIYVCVCVFVYTQNVQLKTEAAYRIHKPVHKLYINIVYYIREHSTC
jgi:hypothetical protein